jgi:hypothetical protein
MYGLLLGVLVVALLLILRNRRVSSQCDEHVQYFNKTYEIPVLPKLDTMVDESIGKLPSMHDRTVDPRPPSAQNGTENFMNARWAGASESQDRVDDSVRSGSNLDDVTTRPMVYEGIKNSSSNLAMYAAGL